LRQTSQKNTNFGSDLYNLSGKKREERALYAPKKKEGAKGQKKEKKRKHNEKESNDEKRMKSQLPPSVTLSGCWQ